MPVIQRPGIGAIELLGPGQFEVLLLKEPMTDANKKRRKETECLFLLCVGTKGLY